MCSERIWEERRWVIAVPCVSGPASCAKLSPQAHQTSARDSALVKRLLKSRPNPPRHPFSLASHRVLLYHRPWLEDQHLLIGHKRTQQECAHTCVPCTSAGLETNIKARQAAKTRNENEEGHAGSRRPLPWHTGAISVEATITCLSLLLFFFLSAVLLRDSFCILWQLLCVQFRCVNFAEAHEDRVSAPLGRSPLFVLFLC